MNVDIAALRAIEREKDIPFETVLEAIETALLTAYRHTEGHQPARARGHRPQDRGRARAGPRDRPRRRAGPGVGRHPRGLRQDRRHHRPPGDRPAAAGRGERADVRRVRGQGGRDRRRGRAARRPGQRPRRGRGRHRWRYRGRAAAGRAGARRAVRPRRADALLRRGCHARPARHADHALPHAPEPGPQAVRARGARARRRVGGDRRGRAGGRAPHQDRRAVDGARGQREGRVHRADGGAGARRDERAGRREDRHHRLVGRPGHVRRQRPVAVEGRVR